MGRSGWLQLIPFLAMTILPMAGLITSGVDIFSHLHEFDRGEGAGGEGIILSVGGGVSPGMPRENVLAMLEALNEFNAARV